MTDSLRCIAPVGDQCGEAATWVPETRSLYWTDVNRFLVHRLAYPGRSVETWTFDEPCVALFLTDVDGVLLLALGSRVIRWEPDTDRRQDIGLHLEGWPGTRFNDGRPGPAGELWLGTMANNVGPNGEPGAVEGQRGELFRFTVGTPGRSVKRNIGIANTVCFSPDRRHFYFGDTSRNVIWRFDYHAGSGRLSNETPFFEGFDRGLPDGSTVDVEGFLWNCRFGGGCIVRVAPDGAIDRVVEMPVSNITTCEFGGEDLRTLFITTAAMMTRRYERLAGSLFTLDAPCAGLPPMRTSLPR